MALREGDGSNGHRSGAPQPTFGLRFDFDKTSPLTDYRGRELPVARTPIGHEVERPAIIRRECKVPDGLPVEIHRDFIVSHGHLRVTLIGFRRLFGPVPFDFPAREKYQSADAQMKAAAQTLGNFVGRQQQSVMVPQPAGAVIVRWREGWKEPYIERYDAAGKLVP